MARKKREKSDVAIHSEEEALRALWRAVLTQAIQDARNTAGNSSLSKTEAREAMDWLRWGGADFEEVCLLADYNPEYIKRKSQGALTREWRLPAGQGWRAQARLAKEDEVA